MIDGCRRIIIIKLLLLLLFETNPKRKDQITQNIIVMVVNYKNMLIKQTIITHRCGLHTISQSYSTRNRIHIKKNTLITNITFGNQTNFTSNIGSSLWRLCIRWIARSWIHHDDTEKELAYFFFNEFLL